MSKEVEKVLCSCCESQYKVIYEIETASGLPKFCCFCSAEIYDEEKNDTEDDE